MKLTVLCFAFFSFCAVLLHAADPSVIAQAERSFSKLAVEKGIRTSFLQFLAEDSVVFHGGPVNGKKFYEAQPDSSGILYWQPQVVEISSAGDLGYSTGPWEFRKQSMQEKPVAYGAFASIWKKQPDGTFKVTVDLGCTYPGSTVTVASLEDAKIEAAEPGMASRDVEAEKEEEALMQKDREFSNASKKKSDAAYAMYAADNVRILRDGIEPVTGKSKIKTAIPDSGKLSWDPVGVGISASGDLGYTYGTSILESDAPIKGSYLHVWKHQQDGSWKLVLDVMSHSD